jgi:PAS domain S-box-containing protein
MQDQIGKRKPVFRFGRLSPRFLITTALLLAVIFLAIILVGIRENQRNMLRMLQREGRALMESVFISAQNTIRGTDIIDDLVVDNIVDVATLIELDLERGGLSAERINLICQLLGFNRIDIVDSSGTISVSNYSGMVGSKYDSAFLDRLPLDEIIKGAAGVVTFTLEGEGLSEVDQLVAAVSGESRPGALVLFMNSQMLDSFNRRVGIGYMIRNIGGQPGIEYIFLQSPDGVVLSSRKLEPVLSIASDPFLENILENDMEDSRKFTFEEKEVLEICRPFISRGLPAGILRVGLSLEGFHQVARNFKIQAAIMGFILFLLTFLFAVLVMANQNFKLVESAYEQFKNITSNVLGGIESAVVAVDADNKVVMLNPKAETVFRQRAANCIGQDYTVIFPDDAFLVGELFKSGQDSIIKEISYLNPDNEELILLATASRLMGKEGIPQGIVGIAHDITDRKRLEFQAEQAERLSELGSLAAGVAHEIRNPLNAISIASQRLRAEFDVASDQKGFDQLASTISAEIDRLNSIIAEFLALARSGRLNRENINLKTYLDEIVGFFKNEAKDLHIGLNSEINGDINLSLDCQEMKKVLGNLIKNSFEAIGRDGEIHIRGYRKNNTAVIAIEDTGPGIAPDELDKIFTPYFTTKQSGTGLGLSISHRIVRDHGGSLRAENIRPHGARFIISLKLNV